MKYEVTTRSTHIVTREVEAETLDLAMAEILADEQKWPQTHEEQTQHIHAYKTEKPPGDE